jgi:rare lipoprotein A
MKKLILTLSLMFQTIVFCQQQTATYYTPLYDSKSTSSRIFLNQDSLVCASNDYASGTLLKVTNLENYRSIIVHVIETGEFYNKHLYLSQSAFNLLSGIESRIIKVKIQVLGYKPLDYSIKRG